MKKIISFISILAAVACLAACADKEEPVKDPSDDGKEETQNPSEKPVSKSFSFKVMSFNVRYPASSDEGDKKWDNRRAGVIEMLKAKKPDLIGVQECYISQRTYIVENLTQYETYGLVRDNGQETGSGETMSILWNKDKFEKVECGTFWLSETPDKPSKGWGAGHYRDCTWILFKEKKTGKMLYYFNTHLDHQVKEAMTNGAKLIRTKINEINTDGYPVILTGDMNVEPSSDVLPHFKMNDARTSTLDTDNSATFTGWGSSSKIIDYLFFEGKGLNVWSYQTVKGPWAGYTYISDHNPVMAEFEYE